MSLLGGITPLTLKKALDGAMLRHETLANNIANVNTPRFKRSDVKFRTQLKSALDSMTENNQLIVRGTTTNTGHIPIGPPVHLDQVSATIHRDTATSTRVDENNVSIDMELATLSGNAAYYSTMVRLLNDYYGNIQTVIQGRV
ncbi:flagellar basal body rod protein FlgB [Candidatus Poribacteria bacterium]|nr:flagellar basal body rod protein FlgB [Candidatus Poribacteria bacterium]MDP6597290.1 flagellar basal body rod protein FlgB [Candidatus Poribacteria bacterium]MDP6961168.1 flagellar basal body rod protein FlgB [Dehalococcoidia bacterium]